MERLDFASVMMVLRRNVPDDRYDNQVDFVDQLFWDAKCASPYRFEYDNGNVCRWLSGLAKVHDAIIEFCRDPEGERKVANRIDEWLLPLMPDSTMAMQELHNLVVQAPNISAQKRAELIRGIEGWLFPESAAPTEEWKDIQLTNENTVGTQITIQKPSDGAAFIARVLCFALQLPYVRRDVRKNQMTTPGSVSPAVVDYIFDAECPKPCRWFLGREQELELLHETFFQHSKVFLHGIPGIGKSELAKAYAKRYRKDYTNVIYIHYAGDLKQAVTDLDFADDRPDESDDARFKRHNRFLRSLNGDTLIIVDNFNAPVSQDRFLDVVMKYRCRILFTTRCRYEDQACMEVGELDADKLLALVGKFYEDKENQQTAISQILELLHDHTFAVELAARLLARGMLTPQALVEKLKTEKAALDAAEKLRTNKDGRNVKATYYEQIHNLFSLWLLSEEEQEILRCLTLVPIKGIPSRVFAEWMRQGDMNTINDLVEMGLVHPKNSREILLHPMIREVAVEELEPSVSRCSVLLDSLWEISSKQGFDYLNNRQLFHTAESIIGTIKKDDIVKYLRFLQMVFQYMDKYRYRDGMKQVVEEMSKILSDDSVGAVNNRACLMDCQAALEQNLQKRIALLEGAIRVLGEIHAGNAHLVANLRSNLGVMYHRSGDLNAARLHLEQAIFLMNHYGLNGYQDRVTQTCNYASILSDQGEPHRGYAMLLKLAREVREHNSDHCIDYALIQETMGGISIVKGDKEQANLHYKRAMAIYEMVYEEEPALLEEKRREIGHARMIASGCFRYEPLKGIT